MNRPLPIGISDFKKLRETGCHYVDKSLFIREIVTASAEVILLPRPRRFGKTLNLSMLRCFFEKVEDSTAALFQDLKIAEDPAVWNRQGKHPVIWLTFKDLKHSDWSECLEGVKSQLYEAVAVHRYLLESPALFPEERDYAARLLDKSLPDTEYHHALDYLSRYLSRHHETGVVVLIDEYDTPIHAGYTHGYYDDVIRFMRIFLSGGLKDNPHLFKGVLTGILRVAKESIFSGLNNLGVYTILDGRFSADFGFTEEETRRLLADFRMEERYDHVSQWYNGYRFGGRLIYNPWSILNYIDNRGAAKSYWANTGDTEMIHRLATREGRELRDEVGRLIEGSGIIKPLYENIVMGDLDRQGDLLWSFLLFSGYLTAVEQADIEMWRLQIPNLEVRLIYRNMVRSWFAEKVASDRLEEMIRAMEKGNALLFERILRQVVLEIMSYHDLADAPERVYHALVIGMLVWMSDRYEIRSNRESGYGRFDLMLRPKDRQHPGIIIEFKRVESERGDPPERTLAGALEQIEKGKYAAELMAAGVERILKMAVAFKGKALWVRRVPEENRNIGDEDHPHEI